MNALAARSAADPSPIDVRGISAADFDIRPHSIHHVNFPVTDIERTKEWYMWT